MSYNVRLFNHYDWINDNSLRKKTKDFIFENKPDFIAVQEYHDDYKSLMRDFKYNHIGLKEGSVGLAIFGNRKMINKGEVLSSQNNKIAIFDINTNLNLKYEFLIK